MFLWRTMSPPVLAVLHPADLFRDPAMVIPSLRDWSKIKLFLNGEWPAPIPERLIITADNMDALNNGAFAQCLSNAQRAPFVVVDTEYGQESRFLTILGLGYRDPGTHGVTGVQVEWPHLPAWAKGEVRASFSALARQTPLVFQNAIGAEIPTLQKNFDLPYAAYKYLDDTMLAHAVLWSEWPHDLEFLASMYGPYPKMKHLKSSDPLLYNWGDVIDTLAVWEGILKEFADDPQSEHIYRTQSLPLIPLITEAHTRGIRVNRDRLAVLSDELQTRMDAALVLGQAGAGYPLSLASPQQLQFYCYTLQKYRMPRQYGKALRSIAGDRLAELRLRVGTEPPDLESEERQGLALEEAQRRVHECAADPVLEARVLYANAAQEISHYIAPCRGVERIYPEFSIHAQANARWSTTGVPMAQLPEHLRDIVRPDEGCVWLGYDWDQIELRILAALAQDQPLLEAFAKGWDLHTLNMSDLFGLPYPVDRVDPHRSHADTDWRTQLTWRGKEDIRRVFAKRFVYRLCYGGDPRKSGDIPGAKQLNLDAAKLSQAANRFLLAHPALSAWRAQVAQTVAAVRFPTVRTFMGRRRVLLSEGPKRIREAYDYPMQAAVSDVANCTAVQIYRELPDVHFMYQMHDGWWWQCVQHGAVTTMKRLKEIVEQAWTVNEHVIAFPATFKVRE